MANTILTKRKTTTGNPTTGDIAIGEMCWNQVDKTLFIRDANGIQTLIGINLKDKALSIPLPEDTDDIPLWYVTNAMTITNVNSFIIGTTNVVWNLQWSATADGTYTNVYTSDITLTSTSGQNNNTGFADATISAGSYLRLKVTTISGTPDMLHLTIIYTDD